MLNSSVVLPSVLPDPPAPCLQTKGTDENPLPSSDIARLASESVLPQWVKVVESYSVKGSPVSLEQGDELLLHYVLEDVERIHVLDEEKHEFWAPVQHHHVYERLPIGKTSVSCSCVDIPGSSVRIKEK